jgi:hypothetical protein
MVAVASGTGAELLHNPLKLNFDSEGRGSRRTRHSWNCLLARFSRLADHGRPIMCAGDCDSRAAASTLGSPHVPVSKPRCVAAGGASACVVEMDFAPRRRMASRRWRPLGVQNPVRGARTAMMGSRNRPVLLMTSAKRLWWASERSRWKGVGSMAAMGRTESRTGRPPSGSL